MRLASPLGRGPASQIVDQISSKNKRGLAVGNRGQAALQPPPYGRLTNTKHASGFFDGVVAVGLESAPCWLSVRAHFNDSALLERQAQVGVRAIQPQAATFALRVEILKSAGRAIRETAPPEVGAP